MELTAAAPAVPAAAAVRAPAPLGGYVAGILSSQVSNNAMHLVQPLVIAELSGSLGLAALVASAETGVHMLGTLFSGASVDRLGSRNALVLATAGRGLSLALIPLAWAFGGLTLPWALFAYTLDAFVRGWVDSAVHALPLGLAEGDRAELDRLNGAYEFTFDLGAVIGPLLLGALLLKEKGFVVHAVIPVGFLLSAFLYTRVPAERVSDARREHEPKAWLDWEGWKHVRRDRRLLAPVLGLALFNLFPLRKVWSAFFAKAVLGTPAAVGWIGAAFGLGGVVGALLFPRLKLSTRGAVLFGAVGTAALAASWAPALLLPMLLGAAVFGCANACAELSLLRNLGELTPAGLFGRVTSVARVGTTSASVTLKAAMAGAFALGLSAYASFAVVGAGLAVMVLAQLAVASRLGRSPERRA